MPNEQLYSPLTDMDSFFSTPAALLVDCTSHSIVTTATTKVSCTEVVQHLEKDKSHTLSEEQEHLISQHNQVMLQHPDLAHCLQEIDAFLTELTMQETLCKSA